MRNYKSLILAGLLAFGFSSCNTDDLEKDIDNLANRVADFEAQVLKLNDEMNIIRVLMDGNKTITKYTVEGDKYVLTLSNGETITLTQGNDGVTYPKVEIIDGNWYVDGGDTGIKAKAEDGIDTPQPPVFKIESGNWHVSYNGGETYEDLKVSATETGTQGESPISDFKLEGNKFVFTVGEVAYTIPVIEDLTCQIAEESDMFTIAQGATREVKINVNLKAGDLVRAIAPVEWKAVVSDYSALTGEQELTVSVTAPSVASKGVLTVEVTRGVNTITDEIVLKTGVTSYYDEYMAGMDIQIGNITINKFTHPNAVLLDSGENITKEGVYFVNGDVTWNGSSADNMIVIATSKDAKPNFEINQSELKPIYLSKSLILKGLKIAYPSISSSTNTKYIFGLAANANVENLIFDDCIIELEKDKHLSYLSNASGSIDNIYMNSTYVSIPATTTSSSTINILNFNTGKFNALNMRDNVFYCRDESSAVLVMGLMVGGKAQLTESHIENNTFINVLANHGGTSSGFVKNTMSGPSTMKNNLFWYNSEVLGIENGGIEKKSQLMSGATFFNKSSLGNNLIYSLNETQLEWQYFRTAPKENVEDGFKNAIELEKVNPFMDGTVPHTGTFTYTDEFKAKGIGANIQ